MGVTDVMVGENCAPVCDYGDVGKVHAFALRDSGARVFIADCDPICTLQACMECFQVVDVPVPQILEEIVELVGEVVCNARTGVRRQDGWTCTNRADRGCSSTTDPGAEC